MKTSWNRLEGVVFVSSCVLVALVLGYLGVDAWTSKDGPPDLDIQVGAPVRGTHGWRVPVTVTNQGDTAAEEVHVRVSSKGEAGPGEDAVFVLSFVPRHSKRQGWVSFRDAPGPGGVEAHAVGYATP
jgi:uncharacterized protein (TIGR02588 family)